MPDSLNIEIEKACAFTGHRALPGDFDADKITQAIQRAEEKGVDTFLCGMAMGFDLLAAECVLKLKKRKGFKLIACIPCPGQERNFSKKDKKRYEKILEKCDGKITCSEHYTDFCMFARDRFMVDNSAYLIAYVKKSAGGAYYTAKYAISKLKEIIFVE